MDNIRYNRYTVIRDRRKHASCVFILIPSHYKTLNYNIYF